MSQNIANFYYHENTWTTILIEVTTLLHQAQIYMNFVVSILGWIVIRYRFCLHLPEHSFCKSDTWVVNEDNLDNYVGKPIFTSDRLYDKDPLSQGIVMGLAWTSMGGSALYIETQAIKRGTNDKGKPKGGGGLKVTGQ